MAIRVKRERTRGWKLPSDTVCVDRSTRWGNPYKIGESFSKGDGGYILTREYAIMEFRNAIDRNDSILGFKREDLWKLRGKNLACWCDLNQPCHADVLLELANAVSLSAGNGMINSTQFPIYPDGHSHAHRESAAMITSPRNISDE